MVLLLLLELDREELLRLLLEKELLFDEWLEEECEEDKLNAEREAVLQE